MVRKLKLIAIDEENYSILKRRGNTGGLLQRCLNLHSKAECLEALFYKGPEISTK
jgi:hypothetical protein